MTKEQTAGDEQNTGVATTETAAPEQVLQTGTTTEHAAAPASEEKVSTDGKWYDSLSDELKGEKSIQSYESMEEAAKALVNAQKLVGKKITEMTPEELQQINVTMGAPESPEGYDFSGLDVQDEQTAEWFKNIAHKNGISNDVAKSIVESQIEMANEANKMYESQVQLQMEEDIKTLKSDFGAAYDERVDMANKALREFGDDQLIKTIADQGLINNPSLVKMLSNVGKMISEGNIQNTENTGKFGLTPDEARDKINTLKADENYIKIMRGGDADKKDAQFKRMEDLYRLARR